MQAFLREGEYLQFAIIKTLQSNLAMKGDKTMKMKYRITLAVAVLILSLGVLSALVAALPSPAQVAGGWCGGSCADLVPPPPLEVAGGWCGSSCLNRVLPPTQ